MKTTRRDFLKGLMALSGAAVVGLPEVEWQVAEEEVIDLVAGISERPVGRLGSLRIGDQWFALHDAWAMQRPGYSTEILCGGGEVVARIPEISSWSIECDLETTDGLRELSGSVHPIEVLSARRSFTGEAVISSFGTTVFRENVYCNVNLDGIGELKRSS